jgi:hypothetical protein
MATLTSEQKRTVKRLTKDIIGSPAPVWSEVGDDRKEVAAPSDVLRTGLLEQNGPQSRFDGGATYSGIGLWLLLYFRG